jgi:hypothetical protein
MWRLRFSLIIGVLVVLSGPMILHAQEGGSPTISGPVIRGAVEPKVNEAGLGALVPAERYTPGAPVRVMPDLRLSNQPGVSPPVSPKVQDRDLREGPSLTPTPPGQLPRVMPDLKESPSNLPERTPGKPPAGH